MSNVASFQQDGPLHLGRLVIEASAGTGKTYSLSGLVARHIAERDLTPAQVLVVTFTKAAAAELRERTRDALVAAAHATRTNTNPHGHQWIEPLLAVDDTTREVYRDRLARAEASFDDAVISTIHGFCQSAQVQVGLRSGAAVGSTMRNNRNDIVDEVARDLLTPILADKAGALNYKAGSTPSAVFEAFVKAVRALLDNPGAKVLPSGDATPNEGDTHDNLVLWCSLVKKAEEGVRARLAERHELGYDDLISTMFHAVCVAPDAHDTIALLRSKYKLVMVDEFQDTDPMQWQIFVTAFADRLITVGDPKQAIYRFRGADLNAYLSATDGAPKVRLDTNFRSDADLVAATNSLLAGLHMGNDRIVVEPVMASPTKPVNALGMPPLQLRWVPYNDKLKPPKRSTLSAPLVRRQILFDLVGEVGALLAQRITDANGESRMVKPGDIAILVPSTARAADVARALRAAGIPSSRARTGSVLETPARSQWSALLAALERPSDAAMARGAAFGPFFAVDPTLLDPLHPEADDHVSNIQRRLATWADRMTGLGFMAWYDLVRSDSGVAARLLGRPQGERHLTDLDHIAELLSSHLDSRAMSPGGARRALAELTVADDGSPEFDEQMRRIDSDAAAVQIVTLHSSKGLQYPIVLIPMSLDRPGDASAVYTDQQGVRTVDIAFSRQWTSDNEELKFETRKDCSLLDLHGDHLRLMYVAFTRAEHRTVVWTSQVTGATTGALNEILFDRNEFGEPLHTAASTTTAPTIKPPKHIDVALDTLSQRSGGLIDVVTVPLLAAPRPVPAAAAPATEPDVVLSVADTKGRIAAQPSWRRWSFTAVTRTRDHDFTTATAPLPVVGGVDEPDDTTLPNAALPASNTTQLVTMPWSHVGGGTAFGTLVHSMFEHIDPASPTLRDDLEALASSMYLRAAGNITASALVDGMEAAITTPLGPIASHRALAQIPASDRLAELDFDLPIDATVTTADIGKVLVNTLDPTDPQMAYAKELADGRFDLDLDGYLQGSIDAVLRIADPGAEHRYIVVDYKTNRLHQFADASPIDAYHPHHLPAHMAHSDYPLQALLYSVALHRYLSVRLGASYQPHLHLGGIAYLFVRGMVGPATPLAGDTPFGVFAWQPSARTVVALHDLFRRVKP